MTAREVAAQAAEQHRRDATYHRIRRQRALTAHCEEDALLLDRIAQLIDRDHQEKP